MKTALLIIDPQNDFHDISPEDSPGAASPALAVQGACEDSKRLAGFITRNERNIDDIYVTLDTHADYDIGHPMFWQDAEGNQVAPFTQISHQDIESGRFVPVDPEMNAHALDYTRSLEAGGRFNAMVWPTHCVKGTWGWVIYKPVMDAIKSWSEASRKEAYIKEKGKNQLTEHYGAFAAEYVIPEDHETRLDVEFLDSLAKNDVILVGGQALSHCVGESVRQMVMSWPKELVQKIVLLRDTTSPVPGFESFAEDLISELRDAGVQIMTSNEFEISCISN